MDFWKKIDIYIMVVMLATAVVYLFTNNNPLIVQLKYGQINVVKAIGAILVMLAYSYYCCYLNEKEIENIKEEIKDLKEDKQ